MQQGTAIRVQQSESVVTAIARAIGRLCLKVPPVTCDNRARVVPPGKRRPLAKNMKESRMRRLVRLAFGCWASVLLLALSFIPAGARAQGVSLSTDAQASTSAAPAADAAASTDAAPAAVAESAASAPEAQPLPGAAAAAPDEDLARKQRRRELRAGSTYYGPVGGIYVVDAGSGAAPSFRLQAMTDLFVKKDYLYKGDKDRYTGGVLSLGITPIKYLELSAAVSTRANSNTKTTPEMLQAVGDLSFDVKGYYEPVDGFTFGADVMVNFLNGPGKVGVDFAGTSFTARANFALDLRKLAHEVPLQLRLNAGYIFDNSTEMVEDLEDARYNALVDLGLSNASSKYQEYRHLVRRDERLALGINRVDRALIAVGAEVPLEVNKDFAIHPILEWELQMPVNRRDFDCPYPVNASGSKIVGADSCLDQEGADTWPQHMTVGARVYPWVPGLNVLAGVDIGLGGTTNFVQELAPTAPYKIMLALGYTADLKKQAPEVREVEKLVEVEKVRPVGHVHGSIVEQGVNTSVGDARVSFKAGELNSILATADGKFVSYPFDPGPVDMDIEAPGYQPATCGAVIPEGGGDVNVTCELVALPRVGTIVGEVHGADGALLPNVSITLTGPETRTLASDASGHFREQNLPSGEYQLRIEQPDYLLSVSTATVKVREETPLTITLVPTPKNASVQVKKDRLQIKGTIYFTTDTADIEPRSEPLLTEIADVLMHHPEIQKVEVGGHTDNTGTAEHNMVLSQKRAEAVETWLTRAGVARERLVAKGYGMEKPLVPNLTPQGKSRNRRVEFVILERSEQP
jgi:outer membrane protein OmpA-like peptidoglycan-associated protein